LYGWYLDCKLFEIIMWDILYPEFSESENRNLLQILNLEDSFDQDFLSEIYDTHEFDKLLKWVFSQLFSQYLSENIYKLFKDIIFGRVYIWFIPDYFTASLVDEVLSLLRKVDENALKSLWTPVSTSINVRICWSDESLMITQKSISNILNASFFLWKILDKYWNSNHKWEFLISYIRELCTRVANWYKKSKWIKDLVTVLESNW